MHQEFTFHKLTPEGIEHANHIALVFDHLLLTLEAICGRDGREMAIVRTKLEEACFFAKKSMANQNTELAVPYKEKRCCIACGVVEGFKHTPECPHVAAYVASVVVADPFQKL